MERASSPEYLPELQLRALSEELRAHEDHEYDSMPPDEVRLHLGSLANSVALEDEKPPVLEPVPPGQHISVELRGVSAFVPKSLTPPSMLSKLGSLVRRGRAVDDGKYRQVLFGVSGSVRPGEVLALMGPSGSGKTTLLSILGGREQKGMRVEGQVRFNGQPLTKRLKRRVGYVMQDDLLYESLTVHETLLYAALLRLPAHMSEVEKAGRVEDVIRALGLELCRDTIIGGFFRKGISGGERKRTSVGHELLINPGLIFLDEPTSGLDSTTAMHLLGVLRQLAAGGRAVVTTIHQPSSRLYQQLDKLLLLSQGHAMYYGRASLAPDFFGSVGYVMPYGTNAADFLLDLASGDIAAGGRDGEDSRLYLIKHSEAFLSARPLGGFTALGQVQEVPPSTAVPNGSSSGGSGSSSEGTSSAPPSPSSSAVVYKPSGKHPPSSSLEIGWQQGKLDAPAGRGDGELVEVDLKGRGRAEGEPRWGTPFVTQVQILLRRSLRTRRFESFSLQNVLQMAAIALLAGLFWLQKAGNDTVAAARNTLGLLFFSLMFLSIRTMFVALFTFPAEHKMMLKERASGMYRLSAFYVARILSDLPMDFALPSAFMATVYFMGGLRYNALAFFGYLGSNLLAMLVGQSLGLLLGALVMNPKSAQALASVVTMSMVLTGGFFVVGLPSWIAWAKYVSYIYYALGLLLYIEFDGGNRTIYNCVDMESSSGQCIITDPSSPEQDPSCTPVTDLQDSLGLVQDPTSQMDAVRDALVLLGALLFFRVAIYYVLRHKTSR